MNNNLIVKLTKVFLLLCVCSIIQSAKASSLDNFYIGATGSIDWLSDQKFNYTNDSFTETRDYKIGKGFGLQVGYIIDPWRFEVECLFKTNKLKTVTDISEPADPRDGTLTSEGSSRTLALMFNTFYYIPLNEDFKYYIGGGVGFAKTRVQLTSIDGATLTDPTSYAKTGFAWQLLTGIAYQIAPSWEASIGYRFFVADNVRNEDRLRNVNKGVTQSFEIGLKYLF